MMSTRMVSSVILVFLLLPSLAFGASALYDVATPAATNVANKIGAGEDGVIGSFTVTDKTAVAGGSKVTKFVLDARVATIAANTMRRADIAAVSVWVDVNQNGKLERNVDTAVGSYSNTISTPLAADDFGSDAAAVLTITPAVDDQISLTDGQTKWVIIGICKRRASK